MGHIRTDSESKPNNSTNFNNNSQLQVVTFACWQYNISYSISYGSTFHNNLQVHFMQKVVCNPSTFTSYLIEFRSNFNQGKFCLTLKFLANWHYNSCSIFQYFQQTVHTVHHFIQASCIISRLARQQIQYFLVTAAKTTHFVPLVSKPFLQLHRTAWPLTPP